MLYNQNTCVFVLIGGGGLIEREATTKHFRMYYNFILSPNIERISPIYFYNNIARL